MHTAQTITLFHAPQTRSSGALTLLEELKAPYSLHLLDLKVGEQRQAPYLAVNPMGKVPAIKHGEVIITEQVAISLYLSDLFPETGSTPAIGDALRGPYLRWHAFYAACFEPAMIDKAMKREPGPQPMSGYGDVETTANVVLGQLERGPWMLGETFTTLDVLWGRALTWMTGFGLLDKTATVGAYIERFNARPSVASANAIDEKILQDKVAKA